MRPHFLVVVATLLLACAAYGRDGVNSETIRLRHIGPDNVTEAVKTRQGIEQIVLNYADNSVTVRGNERALAKFKTDLQLADVEAPSYWVEMHVVRVHVDAMGKHVETIVMAPTVSTISHVPASCTQTTNLSGYSVLITASQNPDKTVSVTSEVRELGSDGDIVSSGKNTRNIKPGETTRTVGMTDATDKALRRAVHHGEIAINRGEYTGYYLDVKVEQRANTHK